MEKPKKINWKDTNVAMIGSDLDHKIKAAAAAGEPQWRGVGERATLRVWRIEQFRVVEWPKRKFGSFHKGDSYVVLHSYQQDPSKPKLLHDLHIWIGDESTADEYGTAAYKMVECDDLLGGAALQHRETQGRESATFAQNFPTLKYLDGGAASGFRHVEATEEEPHLYRVKGTRASLELSQLRVRRDSMNSGDVFILHAGAKVWVWNGREANKDEKVKGGEVARALNATATVAVLEQGVSDSEAEAADFWAFMPAKVSRLGIFSKRVAVKDGGGDDAKVTAFVPQLFRLDGGGVRRVAKARDVALPTAKAKRIPKAKLDPSHALLLDTGFHCYVWLGAESRPSERVSAIAASSIYFKDFKRPLLPVTILKQGQASTNFDEVFYDAPPPACFCCSQ